MNTDGSFYLWFTQSVTALMTSHSDLFVQTGINMYRYAVGIVLVLTGLQIAYSMHWSWGRAHSLLMMIAIGWGILHFYTVPVPGIGLNFPQIITHEGYGLAAMIESSTNQQVADKLAQVYQQMEAPTGPSLLDYAQLGRYFMTIFMLAVMQTVILFIITFGFVAVGVAVLVGPIFVPFLILPGFERYFWGWFSHLLQYSFYPLIGNAFVYVYAQVLLRFFDYYPPPYDAQKIAAMFLVFVAIMLTGIFGMLRVPSYNAELWGGRSGSFAIPGLGAWR